MNYNNTTGQATVVKENLEKKVLADNFNKVNFIYFIGLNQDMDLPSKPQKIIPEFNEKAKAIYDSFPKRTKDFYNFHGIQMIGCNFPITLV